MLELAILLIAANPSLEPCMCQLTAVGVVCAGEIPIDLKRLDEPRNELNRRLGAVVRKFPDIHLRVYLAREEPQETRQALIDHLGSFGVRREAIEIHDGAIVRSLSSAGTGEIRIVERLPPVGSARVAPFGDVGTFGDPVAALKLRESVNEPTMCFVLPFPSPRDVVR